LEDSPQRRKKEKFISELEDMKNITNLNDDPFLSKWKTTNYNADPFLAKCREMNNRKEKIEDSLYCSSVSPIKI